MGMFGIFSRRSLPEPQGEFDPWLDPDPRFPLGMRLGYQGLHCVVTDNITQGNSYHNGYTYGIHLQYLDGAGIIRTVAINPNALAKAMEPRGET